MSDVRWDRGTDGRLKAWVSTHSDRITLRKCADMVQDSFGGDARDRVGGSDFVFWDFMIGSTLVTVHLERGVGTALLANDLSVASEALVRQIAEHLALHTGD